MRYVLFASRFDPMNRSRFKTSYVPVSIPFRLDTLLPETQATQLVGRFLAVDSAIRAQDGDFDGALESCRAILGAARSIGDEPVFISQLVRLSLDHQAVGAAERALGQGEPSDAALAQLQTLLLDEFAQPLILHGVRGDRGMYDDLIRKLGLGEVPIAALATGGLSSASGGSSHSRLASWGKLMFDHSRAAMLDWTNEAVAIARRDLDEQPPLWQALRAEVMRKGHLWYKAYTDAIPVLLMVQVPTHAITVCSGQSRVAATAILLAAERDAKKLASGQNRRPRSTPPCSATRPETRSPLTSPSR
jgi:hypothetical protein